MNSLLPSVCIDAVLADFPIADALRKVAHTGYPAFEFWSWWDKDIRQINELRRELGLTVAACCTKFISLTNPELRDAYAAGVEASIAAAQQLDCTTLISQVGDFLPDVGRTEQRDSIITGLQQVAPLLESAGITLVIEPLNEKVNHPGYFLVRSDEAFEIVDQVGSSNVKVIYDIYHQQISEGNLLHQIVTNIDKIGHFHAAGNPGRHELTCGEINYAQIFNAIRATRFQGYVGLEYWPLESPEVGLLEVARWFES